MNHHRFSPSLTSYCVLQLVLGASLTQGQSPAPLPTSSQEASVASPSGEEPSTPKWPANMPATPPQVNCAAGQLTIAADNATMASVFAAMRGCIATAIDVPAGYSSRRVFVHLGPGPINQILQSLLGSTDLDYLIQLVPSDPTKVQAIFLTARVSDLKDAPGPIEAGSTPARRAWLETRRNARHGQDDAAGTQAAEPVTSTTDDSSEAAASAMSNQPTPATAAAAKPDKPDLPAVTPTAQAGTATATDTANGIPESTAARTIESPATPADPNAASPTDAKPAPSPDVSALSPADKETQDRITNMEQLFERRKQMTGTPTSSTSPH